jgi:FkbM family methyltransferase
MSEVSIYDYWPAIIRTRRAADIPACVVEVGVHNGDDFSRLKRMSPSGELDWIGFEPDPRSITLLRQRGIPVIEKAVSDRDGDAEFWLSGGWTPGSEGTRWHTDSSSLNRPTKHLEVAPWCRFDECVSVQTVRLDTALAAKTVDLLWVDVQGAQRKVLAGAPDTLRRTRYLYIECHPTPMYEEEPTFDELCRLLPEFAVVKRWSGEVLFRNTRLTPRRSWPFAQVTAMGLASFVLGYGRAVARRLGRGLARVAGSSQ